MSKYDFEIDLSKETSTGLILSKIKKGSVVLEFGCATGRMTRYMKETLECKVYIVELDKLAFQKALPYAEDGICDDILNYQWVTRFLDIDFDAVIFADVLEHLTEPESVLEQASRLLKDEGSIYISLPNITHNDIFLKAYEDRFDYTSTGLLDDTHVHFWGLKNIEEISGKYDLFLRSIEATYCPVGYTEQYEAAGHHGNELLKSILKERQCGEVYQFVAVLDKGTTEGTPEILIHPASIRSHIYLDTGNDFNDMEKIEIEAISSVKGSYHIHYEIPNTETIRRVRLDPVEQQGCILKHVRVQQGSNMLDFDSPCFATVKDGMYLAGPDPMVVIVLLENGGPLILDAQLLLPGEGFLETMQEALMEKQNRLKQVQTEKHQLIENCKEQNHVNAVLQQEIQNLRDHVKAVDERADELFRENELLQVDLGAYIILANKKDQYALELEQQKQNLQREFANAVEYYENLNVVKLHRLAARIWRGIKWRIKRLIGKEERG